MIKLSRIIVAISSILYFVILILFLIQIYRSVSNFNIFKCDDDLKHAYSHQIIPPLVSDTTVFWAMIEQTSDINKITNLSVFDFQTETYKSIYTPKNTNSLILAYAHNANQWLFMLGTESLFDIEFVFIDKDTSIVDIPIPQNVNVSRILSLAVHQQNPEFIALDSTMTGFDRYRYINDTWTKQSVFINPFYKRISKPIASFYHGGWHYILQSNYYKKEELYVPVSSGNTNLFFFKNEVSMYYHNEIINLNGVSLQTNFDALLSGILYNNDFCNSAENYLVLHPFSVYKSICPDDYEPVATYIIVDDNLQRFPLYTKTHDDIISLNLLDRTKDAKKEVRIEYSPKNKQHIFSTNEQVIGKITSKMQNTYLLPFRKTYFLIADNTQFCKLNNEFERLDKHSLKDKSKQLFLNIQEQIVNNPLKFKFYGIPFYITFYPIAFVLAFFIFFVKKVFFTPKRPAYSRRYVKRVYFANFFMPFCVLHIIFSLVFIIELVRFFQ